MGKIAKYLNQLVVGNVFDEQEVLDYYSTDNSALKIKPRFVAFPESTDDIQKLLKFFNQLTAKEINVPITIRGSGSDDTGACLGSGLIISTKKLNRMLEIDPRGRLVRVQSGITLKELNTALSVSGLTIPIDGKDNETIGGLISNCPTDKSAGKYGGIINFVDRIEVVLANGECIATNRFRRYAVAKKAVEKTLEGEIYRKLPKIIDTNEKTIQDIEKRAKDMSGYPKIVEVYKRDVLDLMPLFFGAQGTLGVISEVILRAVPLKSKPVRIVATFKDFKKAKKFLDFMDELTPKRLELYDLKIIMRAKATGKNLDGVIKKLEDGYVVFVSFDEKGNNNLKKVMARRDEFPRNARFLFESDENRSIIDELENSLTTYLTYVKDGERVPILTNFYLPAWNIESFLDDLKVLGEKLQLDLALYGSYASSIYHLRPIFNLEDDSFNKKATTFLKAGAYIIGRQGGQLAGGTPEGRLKAVVTNADMPEAEVKLYNEIKNLFDKNGILNPEIKLGASSKYTLTHFRSTNSPKIML